jgi:hypothetical protein
MCKGPKAAWCCLALFAGVTLASDYDKKTIVTVNEPVMVAGVPVVTLEPGKYTIVLMNHDHSRNIVQFFNERGDHLYTTVLAINNYRLFPKDKTVLTYWETPTGNPPALKAWFAPGDQWGQEFVYPKGLAAKIARESGGPVLTSSAETVAELSTEPVTEVTKAGEEQPLEEAFLAPRPEPAPAVAEATEVARAEPAAPIAEPEPAPANLPATASPFFAIGLAGVLTMASGLFLRKLAARRS